MDPRPERVAEFGSRDINGTVRDLFADARKYIGIDELDGPGVDITFDASIWEPSEPVDLVLCLEVLEHSPVWGEIVENAHRILDPGGVLILTCATHPRVEHSGVTGGPLKRGEYYANVDPDRIADVLTLFSFFQLEVDRVAGDLRAFAVR